MLTINTRRIVRGIYRPLLILVQTIDGITRKSAIDSQKKNGHSCVYGFNISNLTDEARGGFVSISGALPRLIGVFIFNHGSEYPE